MKAGWDREEVADKLGEALVDAEDGEDEGEPLDDDGEGDGDDDLGDSKPLRFGRGGYDLTAS